MASPNPFSQLNGVTLASPPGSLQGVDISIDSVTNSDLFILDHTAAVYVDECHDSRIRIGPVAGFCYVRNCSGCIISVACQQFRAKECKDLIVFLYSASDPHVELCKGMAFAPYNFAYPLQDKHFKAARLNPQANLWSQIYDHSHSDPEERNWELLEPSCYEPLTYQIAELGEPVDPVPKPAMYANNGAEGFQVVGSPVHQFKPAIENDTDPVIIYQEEEDGSKLADVDLTSPEVVSFAPKNTTNPGKQLPPWQETPPFRPNSGRNSTRKVPKDLSASENPLIRPSPGDILQYRIFYTSLDEFHQSIDVSNISVGPLALTNTLSRMSEAAQPFHSQIKLLQMSGFCVLVAGLGLLLALILIDEFVDVHNGGLAIMLFLLIVGEIGTLGYVGWRLYKTVSLGNKEIQRKVEEEAVSVYAPSGVQLTGTLFSLSLTVHPKDSIAALLK